MKIQLKNLEWLSGIKLNQEEQGVYIKLLWGKPLQVEEFSTADDLLFSLQASNMEKQVFDQKGFEGFTNRMEHHLLRQIINASEHSDICLSRFRVFRLLPFHKKLFVKLNSKI